MNDISFPFILAIHYTADFQMQSRHIAETKSKLAHAFDRLSGLQNSIDASLSEENRPTKETLSGKPTPKKSPSKSSSKKKASKKRK